MTNRDLLSDVNSIEDLQKHIKGRIERIKKNNDCKKRIDRFSIGEVFAFQEVMDYFEHLKELSNSDNTIGEERTSPNHWESLEDMDGSWTDSDIEKGYHL